MFMLFFFPEFSLKIETSTRFLDQIDAHGLLNFNELPAWKSRKQQLAIDRGVPLRPQVPATEARNSKLPKVVKASKRCFGVCGPKSMLH